ncbi:MAG: hypothetical protein M3Y72_07615 [Acidobacteriota bacterium]|nr:hypothetical protein [Acidobacteriota bacterium]
MHFIQTLIKNWWLLALCGVIEANISVVYLLKQGTGFHALSTIVFTGRLAVAAGACAIVAGLWRSANGKCWLLALHGLALGALGLIFNGIAGFRISLRTVALLMVLMAMSVGALELATARTLRRRSHAADGWLLGFAGVVSLGFALAFFALGFRWFELGPRSNTDLLLFGSYFGFNSICVLAIAIRLRSWGRSPSRRDSLPPLTNPRHAH